MIRFFRGIRRKLIHTGNLKKYLAYGVGEIFLVAIGILIALQVNNWNHEKNDRKFERKILSEIKSSLELDLLEIQDEIKGMDRINNSCHILVDHLRNTSINLPDSLHRHFAIIVMTTHFNPNFSGFRTLEIKGIDIIETDTLRSNISDLYTSSYEYYDQYNQERIEVISAINLKFGEHFFNEPTQIWPFYELIPISSSKIKTDDSFLANIQLIEFRNWVTNLRANQLEKKIMKSIAMIDAELNE